VFGIQALGAAVIAGVIGYTAWTLSPLPSEAHEEITPFSRVFTPLMGLAVVIGMVSLLLFWLTFRRFPPERPTDNLRID
jgi:hypothetical protein